MDIPVDVPPIQNIGGCVPGIPGGVDASGMAGADEARAAGCAPSQKIYEFFISKWCDMVHSGCVVFKIHVSHGL